MMSHLAGYGLLAALSAVALPALAAPVDASSHRVEVGFSPDGDAQVVVLRAIASARSEIVVGAYSFTSKPVSEALRAAHRKGVKVFVLADEKSNVGQYSALAFLANAGVTVRTIGKYAIYHNKFLVIDRQHVQTGSFNYSSSAQKRNAENVLVLYDVPSLAQAYLKQWSQDWEAGQPVAARY